MSIKHLLIVDPADYKEEQMKDQSVSIELKMVLDDGEIASPFVKMFTIDDFREMDYKDIEDIIMSNTKHIARSFAGTLLSREDCLNGRMAPER